MARPIFNEGKQLDIKLNNEQDRENWRVRQLKRKFLIIKKVGLVALATGILSVSLVGCRGSAKGEILKLMNENPSLTSVELKAPKYSMDMQGDESEILSWTQLDQLKTHPEFRKVFDEATSIVEYSPHPEIVMGKTGCIFVNEQGYRDGNSNLRRALGNSVFANGIDNEEWQSRVYEAVKKEYDDLEKYSSNDLKYVVINTYFDIIQDEEDTKAFNGNRPVTRAEFMSALYRMNEKVNTDYLPYDKENDEFFKAVGKGKFIAQAKQVANYSFLDYKNGSLNEDSINKPISRAEAIYMIIKQNFGDRYDSLDINTKLGTYKDTWNAGDITYNNEGDVKSKEKWQLYLLGVMFDEHKHGLHEDLFKAILLADQLKIIEPDSDGNLRWNEPISKLEVIELGTKALKARSEVYGYYDDTLYGIDDYSKYEEPVQGGEPDLEDGLALIEASINEEGKLVGKDASGVPVTRIWDIEAGGMYAEEMKEKIKGNLEETDELVYNGLALILDPEYRQEYLDLAKQIIEKKGYNNDYERIVAKYKKRYEKYLADGNNDFVSMKLAEGLLLIENGSLTTTEDVYCVANLVNTVYGKDKTPSNVPEKGSTQYTDIAMDSKLVDMAPAN